MIAVPMTIATSAVQIPVGVGVSRITYNATIGVDVRIAEIPKDYGKITFDGQIITVS